MLGDSDNRGEPGRFIVADLIGVGMSKGPQKRQRN
jgi:hypothetical protein